VPTPFDAILNQSRDVFAERLGEAMSAMLDKADEALSGYADKTQDKDAAGHYQMARDVVSKNRADFESEFSRRYLEEFSKRVREVKKALGTTQDLEEAPMELELELVGEEDLDETLKFNDMAARLRRMCDQELGALEQRAAVLLGDANLQAEQNPFGTQAICGAYKGVCKGIESDVAIRRALLKVFDDHFADKVRGAYKEVNELLVENSILPKIKYAVKKTEGGGAAGEDDGEESDDVEDAVEAKVKKATDAAAAAGQDIFQILAKLVGPMTGPGGAPLPGTPGGPPALEGTALLSSLSQLQHGNVAAITSGAIAIPQGDPGAVNVLTQLKETNVGASLGQMDAMTLDIVSMLFDQIFDDPKVPAGVKALVGRLQIPMLKIAIADKAIFSKKDHPARVLLDMIGEFAGRLPADFDKDHPVYPKLDAILHELIEGYEDKVEIFAAANEKLKALVAEQDAAAAKIADAAAKQVEKREKLALARKAAEDAIRARYEEGKTQRPVLDFLVTMWVKHLLLVHLQSGPESEPWKTAVTTMDELIWSVKPKTDPVERKKLATTVPKLLKNLTVGLKTSGADDTSRTAFFAQLMNMHTAVLKMPAEPEKPKAPPPKEVKKDPKKEIQDSPLLDGLGRPVAGKVQPGAKPAPKPPEAKVVNTEEELDFTKPIEVKIGTEVVQIEKTDELDFTAAPAPEAVAAAKTALAAGPAGANPVVERAPPKEVKLPSALKEGTWVGIRGKGPDDPRQPAKLLYVSPLKSRFLFADKRGKTVLECTRVELAKRFKMRDLIILAENPDASLFERIINGVMGKLGHAPS
jgi:hypothetical protein